MKETEREGENKRFRERKKERTRTKAREREKERPHRGAAVHGLCAETIRSSSPSNKLDVPIMFSSLTSRHVKLIRKNITTMWNKIGSVTYRSPVALYERSGTPSGGICSP